MTTRLDHVRFWLDRLYIAADGASLREEDHKKAFEVSALLDDIDRACRGRSVTIVDAAAGKAYVGLLAAKLILGPRTHVVAIEREEKRKPAILTAFRALAMPEATLEVHVADLGAPGVWPAAPEVVVALHACGTASDQALDRAIGARAQRLWLVPCCYGVSSEGDDMGRKVADALGVPSQYGPLRRRFMQSVIDYERVLRLEAAGYTTEVVELVSPTVTPYNLLFRAVRAGPSRRAAEALTRLESLRRAGRL